MSSFGLVCSMSKLNIEDKFSEKFVKDLEKLLIWMGENEYVLFDISSDEIVEWNESLIEFKEPGRNKLESYVKELLKLYVLKRDGEKIDDVKTMIKNFREYKPKKTSKKDKKEKKEKKTKTNVEEKEVDKTIIKNKTPKKMIFNIKDIIINEKVDTEDVYYIETLDFSTKDLIKMFGYPLNNGNETTRHQYEWKIEVISDKENRIYSIYNWMGEDGKFSDYYDSEWHLATKNVCSKKGSSSVGCECQLKEIIKFMNIKLKKSIMSSNVGSESTVDIEHNTIESNIEKDDTRELFNLSEDDSIIDINDITF